MYFILVSDRSIVCGMSDTADGSVEKWKNGNDVWHLTSLKSPTQEFSAWKGPLSVKSASLPGILATG
jgi:hypothetical protein